MFSIQELIYSYQFKLNLDSTFTTTSDFHLNYFFLPINGYGAIAKVQNQNIIGFSNASSNSLAINAINFTLDDPISSESNKSTANTTTLAIGINNTDKINTGKGNDTIVGVANASGFGVALAFAQSSSPLSNINSETMATVEVKVDAVGISNQSKIKTGQGNDSIIGVAKAVGFGIAKAGSQSLSAFGHESLVDLNSGSLVVVNTLAIGIDNQSTIFTGKGHDLILGIASTSTVSKAEANIFTSDLSKNTIDDLPVFDDIETGIFNVRSIAIAETITDVFGIINNGAMVTGIGNDTIIGMANNENFSEALTISEAKSFSRDIVNTQVDGSSLAIIRGNIVGIANQGKIDTGKGNDTIIGAALNATNAVAEASADVIVLANDSNSQANTYSVADTSEAINTGIDNTSGLIKTGEGNDSIIGYGAVGIQGGKIQTGKGNDSIIGYGDLVGVEDSYIALGEGDDYFKAKLVDLEPLTEEHLFDEQSRSIKNTTISGGRGDDLFEIDSFATGVLIDAGFGSDILKLSGNIEDYQITLGSFEDQTIIIQNTDSTLVVENTEIFYFGTNDFAYSFNDLI